MMTLNMYNNLPEEDRKEFKRKLIFAIENDEKYFMFADCVVSNAICDGLFEPKNNITNVNGKDSSRKK